MTHDLREARRQAARDSGGAREQSYLDNLFGVCRAKLRETIELCKAATRARIKAQSGAEA